MTAVTGGLLAILCFQAAADPEIVVLLKRGMANGVTLNVADTERLRKLLFVDEPPQGFTIELALEVVRQRHVRDSSELHEVVRAVFDYWPKDPRLIAAYRDGLTANPRLAIEDLTAFRDTPWDKSFMEPATRAAETATEWIDLMRALRLLDGYHASWAADASVAGRLGKAVLKFQSRAEVYGGMYGWFELAGLTHDRGLIADLRPYLSDTRLDTYTSQSADMPGDRTPMRYKELAANAICRLLGEPVLVDPRKRAPAANGGPYPEWIEWDRKIADLRMRLDRMKLAP